MNRRRFLVTSSAVAAGLGLQAVSPWLNAAPAGHHRLGLQLFTVMVNLEADFAGTLKAIRDIGYREVETIGAFGRDPHHVREMLDQHGLVTPSQHLIPGDLYSLFLRYTRKEVSEPDVHKEWLRVMSVERVKPIIEEGIERAKILGQKFICWQIIWPEQMQTRPDIDAFAAAMNTAGELCAKAGLVFNFHNHAEEFKARDGFVPYEVILESTDPKTVKLELDVYWATRGGVDPKAYLARHRGRYTQLHLKDAAADGDFATVGKGVIDFPAILAAARKAGIEHYYVEYDRSDDPMAVCRDAYRYLQPLM